jgi:hypothetical protein
VIVLELGPKLDPYPNIQSCNSKHSHCSLVRALILWSIILNELQTPLPNTIAHETFLWFFWEWYPFTLINKDKSKIMFGSFP